MQGEPPPPAFGGSSGGSFQPRLPAAFFWGHKPLVAQGPLFSKRALGQSFGVAPEGTRSPWGQRQFAPCSSVCLTKGQHFGQLPKADPLRSPGPCLHVGVTWGTLFFISLFFKDTFIAPNLFLEVTISKEGKRIRKVIWGFRLA